MPFAHHIFFRCRSELKWTAKEFIGLWTYLSLRAVIEFMAVASVSGWISSKSIGLLRILPRTGANNQLSAMPCVISIFRNLKRHWPRGMKGACGPAL